MPSFPRRPRYLAHGTRKSRVSVHTKYSFASWPVWTRPALSASVDQYRYVRCSKHRSATALNIRRSSLATRKQQRGHERHQNTPQRESGDRPDATRASYLPAPIHGPVGVWVREKAGRTGGGQMRAGGRAARVSSFRLNSLFPELLPAITTNVHNVSSVAFPKQQATHRERGHYFHIHVRTHRALSRQSPPAPPRRPRCRCRSSTPRRPRLRRPLQRQRTTGHLPRHPPVESAGRRVARRGSIVSKPEREERTAVETACSEPHGKRKKRLPHCKQALRMLRAEEKTRL